MPAKLILIKPPEREPEPDLSQFAVHLQAARVLWRAHRKMVEAPEFEPSLLAAYMEVFGEDDDPDQSTCSSFQCTCGRHRGAAKR
jgi:hypothetical protein